MLVELRPMVTMAKSNLSEFNLFLILFHIQAIMSGCLVSLHNKATMHQLTTMLSTSKNVLFSGHHHLLTTSADDLIL